MTDSSTPGSHGSRRIDRLLAPDYLAGLEQRALDQVRAMRREAEQEEADLSYIRRLVQGRIDILRAEQARRRGGDERHIVEHLSTILADAGTRSHHGLGRFLSVEPSRVDEHRRAVEQLVADVNISDVEARTEDEIGQALDRLSRFEAEVSAQRRRVQEIMDRLTAEIGRRYKAGDAQVDDLLES